MSPHRLALLLLCMGCSAPDAAESADPPPESLEQAPVDETTARSERADELFERAAARLPEDLDEDQRAMALEAMRGAGPGLAERESDAEERAAIARTQDCYDAVMARHHGADIDPSDTERVIAAQLVGARVRQALMAGDTACSCDAPGSAACAALVRNAAQQ